MNRLAALYARVSTFQQEQEATIESQVAALEAYAQQQGYILSRECYFLDQAVSGAKLARPGLDRLRDLAAEGLFEVVLCLSPDRLARNYAYQCVVIDELQRAGVKVVFANQPAMEDNAVSQLLLGVEGLFAQYERAQITERLRRGKLHRIRQGQLVNPVPPYGYRYIPVHEPQGGRWEPHPVEADVVRQIFAWYTGEPSLTLWDIVRRLNDLASQAPPRGHHWRFSTVQGIFHQIAYTGKAYYNRTRATSEAVGRARKIGRGYVQVAKRVPRPPEEWIEVTVPALISTQTWEQAQERLVMQRRFAQRNNHKHFYLLRSLLVCDVCAYTLVGSMAGGRRVYICVQENRARDFPPHRRSVEAEVIEPLVWQAVCDLLRNPTLLTDAWQNQTESSPHTLDEAQRLQTRLRTLDRQWTRLLDLFQEEQIPKEELLSRRTRLDQERESVTQRLQQLAQEARQEQAREEMIQDFATFCQRVETNLDHPTPEIQQEVIRLLIDHIVVGEHEIVIKHIIPADDDSRLLPGRR